jgi:hypothetical protein
VANRNAPSDEAALRALARKMGLSEDDPQVLEDLRTLSRSGVREDAPEAPSPAPSERPIRPQTIRRLVGALVGLLIVLYLTGRLDHALYPIGLNLHECGRNGYGAVYCGDELDHYRANVEEPINEAQNELRESFRELER